LAECILHKFSTDRSIYEALYSSAQP